MQTCPRCNNLNRPDSHYCAQCGSQLSIFSRVTVASLRYCPQCQTPIRTGAHFCPACGSGLYKPVDHRARPVAERPILTIRWPGGKTEQHALNQRINRVGRAPDNDIILNFPTVSGYHLQLEIAPGGIILTDLNSTNGSQVNGQKIATNAPYTLRSGDTIRIGDLQGNSISMSVKAQSEEITRTRPLGMHRLGQLPRISIGRDPGCQVHLKHPTVSWRHAEIVRQQGNYALRDLRSANGTFVNGQRVTNPKILSAGDVIQAGPFRLVYDGRVQGLTTSISRGHRLDLLGLGLQIPGGRMILEDISLVVDAGEFISLVGGSGAGKSSLIKTMNGYNPATHGQMLIDGEPLYANMGAYRSVMGYVPQDDIIHKELPVHRALWYAAQLRLPDASHAEIKRRIRDVVQMVDMAAHVDKPVRVLSGGQRKRVSIAVELLSQPDLLFLDEPTSGLDPGLEKKMMYDLNRLADRGKTIVLVTHATSNIEQCDHVAFLSQGKLAYYGPPTDATQFFQAQDFADIYLKLSQEINPDEGKPPPSELQSYYSVVKYRQLSSKKNDQTVPLEAGVLWAEHYYRSREFDQFVISRQQGLGAGQLGLAPASPQRPRPFRDSPWRQSQILFVRHLDLIRNSRATLFILLLMMPIIALLFMAVSGNEDLTGKKLPPEAIMTELREELVDADEGDRADYTPAPTAQQLIVMLGLALTQAGTFGAAYEIVKERAIYRREKAVGLRAGAYVVSKLLVLSLFAVIQVASVLLILWIKVDFSFEPVFDFFPNGGWELFVTLLIAVLASITFGLFISAVVPSADVVLYVILVQLFAQIILSGALFPLPDDSAVANAASKAVISNWTMNAMGSSVNIPALDQESIGCRVGINPLTNEKEIGCEAAPTERLDLAYEHSPGHLLSQWIGLLLHALFWIALTIVVQIRQKSD